MESESRASEQRPPQDEPDDGARTPPHGDELLEGGDEGAQPGDEGAAEE